MALGAMPVTLFSILWWADFHCLEHGNDTILSVLTMWNCLEENREQSLHLGKWRHSRHQQKDSLRVWDLPLGCSECLEERLKSWEWTQILYVISYCSIQVEGIQKLYYLCQLPCIFDKWEGRERNCLLFNPCHSALRCYYPISFIWRRKKGETAAAGDRHSQARWE